MSPQPFLHKGGNLKTQDLERTGVHKEGTEGTGIQLHFFSACDTELQVQTRINCSSIIRETLVGKYGSVLVPAKRLLVVHGNRDHTSEGNTQMGPSSKL
jgi:hypothetical protein